MLAAAIVLEHSRLGNAHPGAMAACADVLSALVIPSVPKGLCNQRLRWVQDIVAAKLLGAAVVLPQHVYTRQGCHFEAACYSQYTGAVPFGEVFDANATTAALAAAGICVLSPAAAAAAYPTIARATGLAGPLPAAASELMRAAASIRQRVAGHSWSIAGRWAKDSAARRMQ